MLIPIERQGLGPVSLADAKKHCRVEHNEDDDVIASLLRAAVEYLERATGHVLSPVTYELRVARWCSAFALQAFPVRDVESVEYTGPDGASHVVPLLQWSFIPTPEGGVVRMGAGFDALALSADPDAIRIRFSAGYDQPGVSGSGDDPMLACPETVKVAVKMLLGHWYANRETINIGNIVNSLPFAVDALVSQLRIYR